MLNITQNHLVLGGNGAIGSAVINELKKRNIKVEALTMSGEVNGIKTINADLLDLNKFTEVTRGFSHIYLCIGLPYKTKIWEEAWPVIMENTISVCKTNNLKLIFFDNTYMYGPPPLPTAFDENTTQTPISKKGMVRKKIADRLLEEIKSKKIEALIGRSADFYGPKAINSTLYISFLERMLKGQNPQLAFPINVAHTFAYTEDNAKALVDLATEESAYGEVWHLPVGKPITVEEILFMFNKYLNTNLKADILPRPAITILKLFITPLREVSETLYQFRTPYIMSDTKFMNKFPNFKVTSYEEGVSKMIASFKK